MTDGSLATARTADWGRVAELGKRWDEAAAKEKRERARVRDRVYAELRIHLIRMGQHERVDRLERLPVRARLADVGVFADEVAERLPKPPSPRETTRVTRGHSEDDDSATQGRMPA